MPPPSTNQPLYDALIVGAGPAGLAAATTLARQRQTALVLDTGVYRNARAAHLYNVPGFDHADPADVRTQAKGDLLRRYDTITFKKARITEIRSRSGRTTTTTTTTTTAHKEAKEGEGDKGGLSPPWFEAVDGAGREYRGRTVVLASGVRDVLPQEEEEEEGLEGLDACWGYGIFPSLVSHGFEERGGPSAGLLAWNDALPTAADMTPVVLAALNLAQALTIYTHGDEARAAELERTVQAKAPLGKLSPAQRKRVTVERRRIQSVRMASSEGSAVLVTLADGTETKEAFIAYQPRLELNGPFAAQLGVERGPGGEIVTTPPFYETSIRGVFAAGDAAAASPQARVVLNALNQGAGAGAGVAMRVLADKAAEEGGGE